MPDRMIFIVTRAAILAFVVLLAFANDASAQSGLRESLERLDKNQNGYIDPEEVTPLSRPYLERILKSRGGRGRDMFDDPIRIDRIQEAARTRFALENGVAGMDVRPKGEATVKPFGPTDDEPFVPEFGVGKMRYPYVKADLDQAIRIMSRYDFNDDGYIDRAEAAKNRWTHRNPFDDDYDKDDRLSRLELTQRYARRRLLDGAADELRQKRERVGSEIRSSKRSKERDDSSDWWRRGGSKTWLTASMLGRFDANRNGRLEAEEAKKLGIPMSRIDVDRDGELTREELFAMVSELQERAGDLTEGLPGWFYELDANKDGQVAMHEYAIDRTPEQLAEFRLIDGNNDGLLTQMEVLESVAVVGGSYRNNNAEVLPPRKTVISEIEIEDNFVIEEVEVQLSVTHTYVAYLDAYLTGPDGQRVELFTAIGGSGDHFERTTFADDAETPITKGKAPYEGKYRPEAVDKRQPGLQSFSGKSVNGVWQLVIRGSRNERFGMLHSWGLTVRPKEGDPGNALVGLTVSSDDEGEEPEDDGDESKSDKDD